MAGTMVQELYQALQGKRNVECPEKLDPDSGIEWDKFLEYEESSVEVVTLVAVRIYR